MTRITIHTIESAPVASRELLQEAKDSFGFVPNLYGSLASAPVTLAAYRKVYALLGEASLNNTELQIVYLEISVENGCDYCEAAHSTVAGMQKIPDELIHAVRKRELLQEPKLEALRQFTRAVIVDRGHVSPQKREAFIEAGYDYRQALEVIAAVALKVISNYALAYEPVGVDAAFAGALSEIPPE